MKSRTQRNNTPSPPLEPRHPAGERLVIGDNTYRVLAEVGRGRRSLVYRAADSGGRELALKIACNNKPETLSSLKNEMVKARHYARYRFRHAEIVERGPNYVLKSWVAGIRGDRWTEKWKEAGFPPDDPAFIRLKELLLDSAEKKIYIRDLNQNNLIWDGSDWVIIDSGSVKKRRRRRRILHLYREYIAENWGRSTTPPCADVFRRLLPRNPR